MNHKTTIDQELHLNALAVAGRYLKCVGEFIEVLQKLDERKTFRGYECASLYQYAIKHLKLSEDIACNLIAIARKSAQIPPHKRCW